MTDDNQKGLGSEDMDEQTKHDIQSKGGQASRGGGGQSQDQSEYGDQNEQNESSESQGFAAMEEEGRDEEVSEIASLGGQASHDGGRNQNE